MDDQQAPLPLTFVDSVRKHYPAHYAAYNSEIYFSNMLMTDLRLADRRYRITCYVNNGIRVH